MAFTTAGGEAWNTLVETLAKIDLRTLLQTLTEHLLLIINQQDKIHTFLQHDKMDYGCFEYT